MSTSDLLATIGVSILLVAFVLNQRVLLSEHSPWFLSMNMLGAALCGYAAWLVQFMPFVVLETIWSIFAAYGLLNWKRRKRLHEQDASFKPKK
jgi:hypothetical protein